MPVALTRDSQFSVASPVARTLERLLTTTTTAAFSSVSNCFHHSVGNGCIPKNDCGGRRRRPPMHEKHSHWRTRRRCDHVFLQFIDPLFKWLSLGVFRLREI